MLTTAARYASSRSTIPAPMAFNLYAVSSAVPTMRMPQQTMGNAAVAAVSAAGHDVGSAPEVELVPEHAPQVALVGQGAREAMLPGKQHAATLEERLDVLEREMQSRDVREREMQSREGALEAQIRILQVEAVRAHAERYRDIVGVSVMRALAGRYLPAAKKLNAKRAADVLRKTLPPVGPISPLAIATLTERTIEELTSSRMRVQRNHQAHSELDMGKLLQHVLRLERGELALATGQLQLAVGGSEAHALDDAAEGPATRMARVVLFVLGREEACKLMHELRGDGLDMDAVPEWQIIRHRRYL